MSLLVHDGFDILEEEFPLPPIALPTHTEEPM